MSALASTYNFNTEESATNSGSIRMQEPCKVYQELEKPFAAFILQVVQIIKLARNFKFIVDIF